jgi:hypothetical protein
MNDLGISVGRSVGRSFVRKEYKDLKIEYSIYDTF